MPGQLRSLPRFEEPQREGDDSVQPPLSTLPPLTSLGKYVPRAPGSQSLEGLLQQEKPQPPALAREKLELPTPELCSKSRLRVLSAAGLWTLPALGPSLPGGCCSGRQEGDAIP